MNKANASIDLPKSIWSIIEHGVKLLGPTRVILYGSQARGSTSESSDYDLAFEFSPSKRKEWASFLLDSKELALTLRSVDLLALHEASVELSEKIKEEGIVLYEKDTE